MAILLSLPFHIMYGEGNNQLLEEKYEIAVSYLQSEAPDIEKLKEATRIFCKIVENYPESEITAKAQFGIGNSYRIQATLLYQPQENYRQAIKEYQKFIAHYPKHQKVARAYILIGFCHKEMLNFGSAKEMYQKVIRDYPTSKDAKAAQMELAHLNDVEYIINRVKYKILIEKPQK
jgi:TolA-binding protein